MFFPIVVLLYLVIPRKFKYIWLLAASYYFVVSWNPKFLILILFTTAITYASALLIEKAKDNTRKKKAIIAICIVINLLILAFFKYFDFFINNINNVLGLFKITAINNPFDFVMPVGISFYTFQVIGYLVDVYRNKVPAERNFLKYALFVSFFPKLVSGPIERSDNLLAQINDIPNFKMWDSKRIVNGLVYFFYGLFLKLVVADRVSLMVDCVFDSYYDYDPVILIIAALGFSLQIYCDFASYSIMAVGAGKVMGFNLIENFDTPYFAKSIREFWRRWHISLSTWFRDYLYIPLGGSRCSKFKKFRNVMITFLVSGLWHGAGWNYIIWGFLHGAYQIIGDLLSNIRKKIVKACNCKSSSFSYKLVQVVFTFILVTIAWVFFRADSFMDAARYLYHIVIPNSDAISAFSGGLFEITFDKFEWIIVLVSVVIMFLVGLVKYKKKLSIDEFLDKQMIWFRWACIFVMLFVIIIFGKYGPEVSSQTFIYSQF